MFKLKKGPVLLLGEGDFSFSVAFQPLISDKCSMVSTSYLTEDEVKELHQNSTTNIEALQNKGINFQSYFPGLFFMRINAYI